MSTSTTVSNIAHTLILQPHHQVLRQGLPIAGVIFTEDQDQKTRHYGALNQQGEVICCVTLIPSTWHGDVAWRLSAMATGKGSISLYLLYILA
ncbi:hypothetical protein ACSYAD_31215 [Acaryochloris marina NIES-2412]|uniref:hypothetical protein n=1 Tax=Acaryochloris marina TaxID=155978 RepID=UPI004058436E